LKAGSISNSQGKAMNILYKVANALFDCSSEAISIDIDSARFSQICKQEFYWKRIVISILCIVTYSFTALSSIYAGEEIEIALRNFYDVRTFYGNYEYSPIVEKGIPVCDHIRPGRRQLYL
jgi:hypothetical protein